MSSSKNKELPEHLKIAQRKWAQEQRHNNLKKSFQDITWMLMDDGFSESELIKIVKAIYSYIRY